MDVDGWAPIHYAAFNGHIRIVRALIAHNANVSMETKDKRCAKKKGKGAAGGGKGKGKSTKARPLHLAASGGYMNVVNELIKNGADVNAETFAGETPLHCAFRRIENLSEKHVPKIYSQKLIRQGRKKST